MTKTKTTVADLARCACGAVLALDDEKALGLCEGCAHLGADGKLYATAEEASEASVAAGDDVEAPAEPALTEPTQPSLLPAEPFDEHAAFKDLCAKARFVESYRRIYEERKALASDAKKQLDSALLLLEQTTTTYDAKARAWADEEQRQAQLQAGYVQALEVAVEAPAPQSPALT